ncbi:spore germination protein [Alteribacillus sp. HJP-4]|uniref:spore germination protein n=1 Tax=Alteribacillus sp. HJP-4 TaxID=2775394 RepID=UPI0035CD0AB0
MRFLTKKFRKREIAKHAEQSNRHSDQEYLNTDLKENIQKIKERLGYSSDVKFRDIGVGADGALKTCLIHTAGLVDQVLLQEAVESLLTTVSDVQLQKLFSSNSNSVHVLKNEVLSTSQVTEVRSYDELYSSLIMGEAVLLIDGYNHAVSLNVKGWEKRGVDEPSTQNVIRGPKEGFTESIRTNTSLIRRRIKSPDLRVETRVIGQVTQTQVDIMYVEGIVTEGIVDEVRTRLDRIDIDGILDSGYIEELIEDEAYSPFPTIVDSERPDVVAGGLLEGRVAILVDGSPFVLLVPSVFVEYFQAAEDYYQRADIASLLRLLRFMSFFTALLLPAIYIALTTYHQEILPHALLLSLAAQVEGTPFPALVEALLMGVAFEVLREAGVRMPKAIGQAISIVGALVIGEAAVRAGLVSAAMVIVVAFTAISNFVFPAINMAIPVRILRFGFMIFAATFGLFGIAVGLIALIVHLCSIRSFGIPYMSPLAPFIKFDQKDAIIRMPIFWRMTRPRLINQNNMRRQSKIKPTKPIPK